MAKIALRLRAAAAAIPSVVCDAAGLAGAGLLSYGAWLIYQPAGFIVGGALLMAGSVAFGSRATDARSS